MSQLAIIDFAHHVGDPTDIVLKVGDAEGCLILLHSLVLKIASPVFKSMLEGSFIEGQSKYTREHPLALPEDNAETFIVYCKILYREDPHILACDLPALVTLADKYGSSEKLRDVFTSHLSGLLVAGMETDPSRIMDQGLLVEEVFYMAFLVGDEKLFANASKVVLAQISTTRLIDEQRCALGNLVPESLLGKHDKHHTSGTH